MLCHLRLKHKVRLALILFAVLVGGAFAPPVLADELKNVPSLKLAEIGADAIEVRLEFSEHLGLTDRKSVV